MRRAAGAAHCGATHEDEVHEKAAARVPLRQGQRALARRRRQGHEQELLPNGGPAGAPLPHPSPPILRTIACCLGQSARGQLTHQLADACQAQFTTERSASARPQHPPRMHRVASIVLAREAQCVRRLRSVVGQIEQAMRTRPSRRGARARAAPMMALALPILRAPQRIQCCCQY